MERGDNMRLIDAEFEENHYASMLLDPTPDVTEQDKRNARIIIDALRMAKTVEPQRIRAKWIVTTSLQEGQITWKDYKCSNCSHHRGKPMNFCEVCGAKMER